MTASPPAADLLDRPLGGVVGAGTAEDPRLIVEIWLAVPTDDGWRMLMCHRVERRGGFWQGVSGRVETSDATLRRAALREMLEELGCDAHDELFDMGCWTTFESVLSGTTYRKRSLAALLPAGTSPETITLSHEHDAARLMTFDEARAVAHFPEYVTDLDALQARLEARRTRATPDPTGKPRRGA